MDTQKVTNALIHYNIFQLLSK